MTPTDAPVRPDTTDKRATRFLRMAEVETRVGLKKRTIQNLVNRGLFPKPVNIHERSIGFVESEVESWMQSRIDNRDENGATNE